LVAAPLADRTRRIDNIVVDAASIEVNRRARRAKTDRLDGDKLLVMLLRHHTGERVWSVLREPSAEAEDARRTHRELGRLMHERIAHTAQRLVIALWRYLKHGEIPAGAVLKPVAA
jgi:transposase